MGRNVGPRRAYSGYRKLRTDFWDAKWAGGPMGGIVKRQVRAGRSDCLAKSDEVPRQEVPAIVGKLCGRNEHYVGGLARSRAPLLVPGASNEIFSAS